MNHLANVRLVGVVEAISAIVLFFVAMPLKYAAHLPQAVTISGGIHGLLWVLYLAVVVAAWLAARLPGRWVVILIIVSIIPFGPFLVDHRLKAMDVPPRR